MVTQILLDNPVGLGLQNQARLREMPAQAIHDPAGSLALYVDHQGIGHTSEMIKALQRPHRAQVIEIRAQQMNFNPWVRSNWLGDDRWRIQNARPHSPAFPSDQPTLSL